MGGINDIANAFRAAAGPGVRLHAVRMRYDNDVGEQVYEFDVTDNEGSRTIIERAGPEIMSPDMVGRAAAMARGRDTVPGVVCERKDVEPLPDIGPRVHRLSSDALMATDAQVVPGSPLGLIGDPYAAPEVPTERTPFSSQALDTSTDKETSQ